MLKVEPTDRRVRNGRGHQTWNWVIGHRVNGSFGSSFTSGSPDHHFDPVWDPSFSGFRKNAQNSKRTLEMLKWQESLSGVCCWTEITGCQSMQWTFTFTVWLLKFLESTFGVHYRTGSPGQLGLWIPSSISGGHIVSPPSVRHFVVFQPYQSTTAPQKTRLTPLLSNSTIVAMTTVTVTTTMTSRLPGTLVVLATERL